MRNISTRPSPACAPPEFQLLVSCSRTQLGRTLGTQIRTLVDAGLDWPRVLAQARHQGVTALLYHHISELGAQSIPKAVLEELSTYARKNTAHNLMLSHVLLGILKMLEQHGINAVPYKGPTLTSSAYGNISLRSFKDLDIIVRPQDFSATVAILRALGYTLKIEDPEDHFHESYRNPETGVLIEVHHDVLQRRYFPTSLDLSMMWERRTETTLLGQRVASFTPEDTLLLLCLHGSKHAWQGLAWICDVAQYLRAQPTLDWEELLSTMEQAQLSQMVLLGLQLAHTLLDAPLPELVRSRLNADPKLLRVSDKIVARLHETPGVLSEATLTQRHLALRSGLVNRLPLYRRWLKFVVRPNARDRAWVHLPTGWQAAYYLVRPVRLASCYFVPKRGLTQLERALGLAAKKR